MIRVGLIGCGRIADPHYAGYADMTDACVEAVCDADTEAVERKRAGVGVSACICGLPGPACRYGD